MSTFTGTFTAQGQASGRLFVKKGEKASFALAVADTEAFIGAVQVQGSVDGGQTFQELERYSGTVGEPIEGTVEGEVQVDLEGGMHVRVFCEEFDTDEPSDAIAYTLGEIAK